MGVDCYSRGFDYYSSQKYRFPVRKYPRFTERIRPSVGMQGVIEKYWYETCVVFALLSDQIFALRAGFDPSCNWAHVD